MSVMIGWSFISFNNLSHGSSGPVAFLGLMLCNNLFMTFSNILILFIFVCDDGDLTGFGFADDSVVNVLKLLG